MCTFSTIYESYYFGDHTKWIRTKWGSPVLSSFSLLRYKASFRTYRKSRASVDSFSIWLILVIVALLKFSLMTMPFLITVRAFQTRSFQEQHFNPKWPDPYFLWAYSSPLINPGTPMEFLPNLADLGFCMNLGKIRQFIWNP